MHHFASASGAIVIGFNVRADATARKLIDNEAVDLHYYSIIYDLIDEVRAAMGGLLAPESNKKLLVLLMFVKCLNHLKLAQSPVVW